MIGVIYLSIVGIVLTGMAVYLTVTKYLFFIKSEKTEGRIVDKSSWVGSEQTIYYYPVIEFTDRTGNTHSFIGGFGITGGASVCIGKTLPVRYLAENPQKTAQVWTLATITVPVLAFLLLGGVALFAATKQ